MAGINMNSILKKAKDCMKTPAKQNEVSQKIDEYISGVGKPSSSITLSGVHLAAGKFIEVLQNEIESHSGTGKLGATAIAALTPMEHGSPYKVGKNRYKIDIWFTENLSRDSLAPDYFDGVENLAALLNNGYNAKNTIYGVWLGHNGNMSIPSLQNREGVHFIENAIRDYKGNYAAEYGVIDIEYDDIYKNG
jgi:hypothetical protein